MCVCVGGGGGGGGGGVACCRLEVAFHPQVSNLMDSYPDLPLLQMNWSFLNSALAHLFALIRTCFGPDSLEIGQCVQTPTPCTMSGTLCYQCLFGIITNVEQSSI